MENTIELSDAAPFGDDPRDSFAAEATSNALAEYLHLRNRMRTLLAINPGLDRTLSRLRSDKDLADALGLPWKPATWGPQE